MIKLLFLTCFVLLLCACQSTSETGYGIQKDAGEVLDMRDQNLILGSQKEISRLYSDLVKNETDGLIIIKQSPFPEYPRAALRAGIEGAVVVEFTVNKKGKVILPIVLISPGKDFEKASLACLTRWQFEPILKDGKPVDTKLRHTFQFMLKDG
jgi:TonB family protein